MNETFGFKTTNSPPPIPDLKEFEEKMLSLVQNIEFRNTSSEFQKKLARDIHKIQKDNMLFVPADKTNNFYRVTPASYKQLLKTNITKTYKKAPVNDAKKIVAGKKRLQKA